MKNGGKEYENKPAVLAVFKFDWAEDKQDMELHKQVRRFWALESHIFSNNGDTLNSLEDKRALQILKRTTRLKDRRYEVDLLWRNNNPELPNNLVRQRSSCSNLNGVCNTVLSLPPSTRQ